jgi:lactoylglutathione lyase
MRYLHSMVRFSDLDLSLAFILHGPRPSRGCQTRRAGGTLHARLPQRAWRHRSRQGRGSSVSPAQAFTPAIELTFNWDGQPYPAGRNFVHLAFPVDDIYATCRRLLSAGVAILRPPREGKMAFRALAGQYLDRTAQARCRADSSRALADDAKRG